MNPDVLALYEKIQAFSMDAIDAAYPLSRRLTRENRWILTYTQRTIAEYKKFILLAMVSGHFVTPSEQIDQVWHLHLIYIIPLIILRTHRTRRHHFNHHQWIGFTPIDKLPIALATLLPIPQSE